MEKLHYNTVKNQSFHAGKIPILLLLIEIILISTNLPIDILASSPDDNENVYLPFVTTSLKTETNIYRNFANYLTVPDDVPPLTVTLTTNKAGNGYIFLSPQTRGYQTPHISYLMILDNQGELIYYKRDTHVHYDFKKHPNNQLSVASLFKHELIDFTYNTVKSVYSNGEPGSDFHDLQLLPNGNILLLVYEERYMDMSQVVDGGDPNALVIGCRIEELNSNQELLFSWSSFDHIPLTDTYNSLQLSRVDYVHCNSIEEDWDGHLLLSGRDIHEVTKINRQTGEIIWRFGGKQNEFRILNETEAENSLFIRQHAARRTLQGTLLLFDNGIHYANSRVVEYELDETLKTATLIWEYRNTPDVVSNLMGNAQRLSNGNTFIGWGSGYNFSVTEVTSEGEKRFELVLDPAVMSYRAFRFPWHGRPSTPPTLLVDDTQSPTITLTYSWNGATDVVAYRVYGDKKDYPTTLITTQAKQGFETRTILTNMSDVPYNFRVEPIFASNIEQ